MEQIIKRKGHLEPYNSQKVYKTIYNACMDSSCTVSQAQLIAEKICKEVELGLGHRQVVGAHEIKDLIHEELKKLHPDASYLYRKHGESSGK